MIAKLLEKTKYKAGEPVTMILYWLVFFAVVTVAPAFRTTKVPTRPTLRMAVSTAPNYNTFVNAESSYEAMCSLDAPGPVSLSDYMKLPGSHT
jgi:hypothetical protein